MPNYETRRYNAETARREADELIKRHGLNAKTMPHVQGLMNLADNYDAINEREEARRGGTRGEYDEPMRDAEMRRRRDSKGRYMEYDNAPQMVETGSDRKGYARHYPYYPSEPYLPYNAMGHSTGERPQIGFSATQGEKKSGMEKKLHELSEYHRDYLKHKELFEQTNDPMEKQHMTMELKEFADYFVEIFKKLSGEAKTPEEQQIIQQMKQKI